MAAQSTIENARPSIVILTLEKPEFYNEVYQDFNDRLKYYADVEQVTTLSEARAVFNRNTRPTAILSADESLAVKTGIPLVHDTANYVRAGGVLVFMGLFSSFTTPPNMDRLFKKFDLPWTSGAYHRTTSALNPAVTTLSTGGMASNYSQKAVHIANVSHINAVYLPTSESRVESRVFGPVPIDDLTEAPAAFAVVGAGRIGYIGDCNNEEETPTVVLRMCGLGL